MTAYAFPDSPSVDDVWPLVDPLWKCTSVGPPAIWAPIASTSGSGGGSGTIYGTGMDGAAVLDGTNTYPWCTKLSSAEYRLDYPAALTNLTINSGVQLTLNGFNIFGTGLLTLNGVMSAAGGHATSTVIGSTPPAGLYGGASAAGAGNSGTGSSPSGQSGGLGGRGGAGGNGASFNGGNVSGWTANIAIYGGVSGALGMLSVMQTGRNTNGALVTGGGGGAGGGGDGSGGVKGGPSGGAGGLAGVFFRTCTGTGTITAAGGNGWPGIGTDCGGGGGGGGGVVWFVTSTTGYAITLTAAKGLGGAPTGTGLAGANGIDGHVVALTA